MEEGTAICVVGVLVETHDVAVVAGHEPRYGGDDASPVGAVHGEAGMISLRLKGTRHDCCSVPRSGDRAVRSLTHWAVAGSPPKA